MFDNFYDLDTIESDLTNDTQKPNHHHETEDEYAEIKRLYLIEKQKWYFVSENSDNLSYEQFYQFVYSEEFPFIRDYELHLMFNSLDSNKDGYLSIKEFIKVAPSNLIF